MTREGRLSLKLLSHEGVVVELIELFRVGVARLLRRVENLGSLLKIGVRGDPETSAPVPNLATYTSLRSFDSWGSYPTMLDAYTDVGSVFRISAGSKYEILLTLVISWSSHQPVSLRAV